jgi:exopolysaccharide biosynthesis protein
MVDYMDLRDGISDDELDMLDPRDDGKKHASGSGIWSVVWKLLLTLLVTVVILCAGIYALMCVVMYGPSKTAREQLVMSLKETSAIGFMANWFLSDDEVQEILDNNSIKDTDVITNTSLVVLPTEDSQEEEEETPDIQIIDIKGTTYKGKLMIVKDPSRVFVGTVPEFNDGDGLVVSKIAARYGAIGGINGGEFVDGTITSTAMPVGLVISEGKIVNGDTTTKWHVTGFTSDNILVVGNMTGQQALDLGVRDCVSINNSIGPFLIINGEAQEVSGIGGGINPRTAIGQRADGAVLLLTVDGRQVNTIGASFADLLYIMQEYGAVNASTMDGGTSTQMYYDGEVVNTPYAPTGPRQCPTAFLVK